jgi:hypothetical protein
VSRAAELAKNWKVAVAAVPLSATSVPPAAVVYCVPVATVSESALPTACEGTELSTPIPNAATATSAIRLKCVFVDIYFLSLVKTKYVLIMALSEEFISYLNSPSIILAQNLLLNSINKP